MALPIWIVVANGSRARLLQRRGQGQALTELRDWVHPATRQHHPDLAGGHRQSGIQGRTGLAQRSTVQDHERSAFAHEIGQWLSHGLHMHQASCVALLASNPFLGDLMTHDGGRLHQHLCASHAVDLTNLPLAQLDARLWQDYRL